MTGKPDPAMLRFALTPEDIWLDLNINGQDDPFTLDRVVLSTAGELPCRVSGTSSLEEKRVTSND